jgi:hypothetical protein
LTRADLGFGPRGSGHVSQKMPIAADRHFIKTTQLNAFDG